MMSILDQNIGLLQVQELIRQAEHLQEHLLDTIPRRGHNNSLTLPARSPMLISVL